jgi:type IV secretion system protein VirB5
MKKWLLSAAVGCLVPAAAHAQGMAVYDNANLLEQLRQTAQEAKTYLLQTQQYAQQVRTYMAFAHNPSLGAAMGIINQAGLGNSLPINPMQLQGLTSGSVNSLQGFAGKLSSLSGLLNSNFAANHVYTPTNGSFGSQQLAASGYGIAGTQAAAQAAYADIRNHLPVIQSLRDRLATAGNPKDVADAQAQLQAETVWTTNLQAELSAISINYQAAQDSREQQSAEALDKDMDAFLATANAQGRGLN